MKKYFLNKMSTGKRLAKRSIVGTRVCAPGNDGIWYSGKIEFVKTATDGGREPGGRADAPGSGATGTGASYLPGLTTPARYTVLFDNMKEVARLGLGREFRETDLIGRGFRTIADVKLKPGQKVFLTYNGRENTGEVIAHDDLKDEVKVRIAGAANGPTQEAPIELTKRLEEIRLLESRRSQRLAVQEKDTDFARLADMAGDRRRQSNSIDVPFSLTQQNGSRKRRPSYSQDDREYYSINDDDPMDECNAALVLMSLSCSPNSSVHGYETILGTSSGSSTTSWSTGSTSPPLSEDGHSTPPTHHYQHELNHHHHHNGRHQAAGATGRGARTTSLSTSDEGIGMEYNEDMPRKRRVSQRIYKCTWKGCGVIYNTCPEITQHVRNAHLGPRKPNEYSDEEDFFFTETEDESDESAPNPPSPPTLSHRDMARPPHEDPEYQRQIVGTYRQGLLSQSQALQQQQQQAAQQQHQVQQQIASIKPPLPAGLTVASLSSGGGSNGTASASNGAGTNGSNSSNSNGSSGSSNGAVNPHSSVSPLIHHNYTWSQVSPTSPQKHVRLSPRPSASYPYPSPNYQHHYQAQAAQQQQQHHQQQLGHIQLSPGGAGATGSGNNGTAAYHQLLAGAAGASSALALGAYSTSPSSSGGGSSVGSAGSGQHRSPVSPNRRTRGENKKCRKVYGMDHKDQWCTQCKWKKACSRFGD